MKTKEGFFDLLRHEAQHVIDLCNDGYNYTRTKSEVRAYYKHTINKEGETEARIKEALKELVDASTNNNTDINEFNKEWNAIRR